MWEKLGDSWIKSWRMNVPGGWIVRSVGGESVHQIFVSDPSHDWELEDAPTKCAFCGAPDVEKCGCP